MPLAFGQSVDTDARQSKAIADAGSIFREINAPGFGKAPKSALQDRVTDDEVRRFREESGQLAEDLGNDAYRLDDVSDESIRETLFSEKFANPYADQEMGECLAAAEVAARGKTITTDTDTCEDDPDADAWLAWLKDHGNPPLLVAAVKQLESKCGGPAGLRQRFPDPYSLRSYMRPKR